MEKKEKAHRETPDTTDGLIEQLGGCGLFQVLVNIVCSLARMSASWDMYAMVFGMYNPGMECGKDYSNDSEISDFSNYSSTSENRTSFLKDGSGTSNSRNCDFIKFCNGSIKFRDTASTVVTEWHLVCDRGWIPTLIIVSQMTGLLVSSVLSGYAATRFGRKTTMLAGVALGAIFNFTATLSGSWQMFAAVRFLIGMSAGNILVTANVFKSEFLTNWWRGFAVNFPDWPIGTVLLSMIMFLLRDWRQIHYTTSALQTCVFVLLLCTPESVRWLAVNGKISKANQVVQRISSINRKPVPDTAIFEKLYAMKSEHERDGKRRYSYIALFRDGMLKTTVLIGFVKFSLAAAAYSLTFSVVSLSGNFYLNFFLLQISGIPVRFLISFSVNIIGRRYSSIACLGSVVLVSVGIVIIHFTMGVENGGLPTTVLTIVCGTFLGAGLGIINSWAIELYPTTVRSLAYSWCQIFSRIGTVISPFLMSKDSFPLFASFLVVGSICFLSVISLLTFTETKGKPLLDVINENNIETSFYRGVRQAENKCTHEKI